MSIVYSEQAAYTETSYGNWFLMILLRITPHCVVNALIFSLMGLTFLLVPVSLPAQSQFPLDGRMSVCVDPPDPPVMVRSDAEKQNFANCRRWSDYTPTYSFIESKKFTTAPCDPKIPPVNLFARHLLKIWGQALGSAPSTMSLHNYPGTYNLTEVSPNESRSGSMAVWKNTATSPGMVAFVLEDRAASAEERGNLGGLQVIYPSDKRCGELISVDAAILKTWIGTDKDPKFLRPKYPRLYWNHWIQGNVTEETIDVVTVGEPYRYFIDISPFQYQNLIKGQETTRGNPQDPSISSEVKIRFYPIGEFANPDPHEHEARVTSRRTNETSSRVRAQSYTQASQAYGTLQTVYSSTFSAVSYDFQVSEPGCHQIVILITDESTLKVVGAWVKPFMAYSSDSDVSSRVIVPECSDESGGAHLFNVTIPTWLTPRDKNLRARITYLDIAERTFGYFEDFRYDVPNTYTWKLRTPNLKDRLSSLTNDIDSQIENAEYRLDTEGVSLRTLLFTCEGTNDDACPGSQAWQALQEIALQETSSPVIVEVVFRDIKNNSYFIPFHLVSMQSTMLGSRLRVSQPLPMPPPPYSSDTCVNNWYAGLILSDKATFLSNEWRSSWKSKYVQDRGTLDLDQLRDHLLGSDGSPQREGLIILAHHGRGEIQAEEKAPLSRRILSPDHIQRKFSLPSVAVLVTCSVGAPGSAHRDNNALIYGLNKGNIVALVASPFKVPLPLAKRFMELLGEELQTLNMNKSFFEIFSSVKKRLKDAPQSPESPDTPHLRSIVDSFMLLGTGDVSICKSRGN